MNPKSQREKKEKKQKKQLEKLINQKIMFFFFLKESKNTQKIQRVIQKF